MTQLVSTSKEAKMFNRLRAARAEAAGGVTSSSLETVAQRLQAYPLFAQMDPSLFVDFLGTGELVRYRPNARIYVAGENADYVYFLLDGQVGAFNWDGKGNSFLVKLFTPLSMMGEVETIHGITRRSSLRAFRDGAVVFRVPAHRFSRLLDEAPNARRVMVSYLASRLTIADGVECSLAFDDVATRMAGLLASFAHVYGEPVDDERLVIRDKLSARRLSELLAVTQRSVERVLALWLKEGWLEREGRFLKVNVAELHERVSTHTYLLLPKSHEPPRPAKIEERLKVGHSGLSLDMPAAALAASAAQA